MDIIFYIVTLIILIALIYRGKAEFSTIIMLGLLLRLALMIVDLYHIFPVLYSGDDTERFHQVAVFNRWSSEEVVVTNYTKFLTIVYSFFWESNPRMVAQFINVLFGTGVILIVRQCLLMLPVAYKTQKLIMLFVSFMPNVVIFSAILLREAWIEFFSALSLLFFLRWFLARGYAIFNMFFSIVCVFFAAYMHAGVIGLGLGYMLAYTMHSPKYVSDKMTFSNLLSIVMAVGLIMFFLTSINTFGGKFANVEMTDEYMVEELTTASSRGGSNYMSWLNTSSLIVGIVTMPLRMFFFLFSPIPPYMRGLSDVFAFVCDGFIYLYLMWHIMRARLRDPKMKRLRTILFTSILITTMIFGLGTSTSGTAMRHRAKYLSVIVLTYAVCQSEKYKKQQIL